MKNKQKELNTQYLGEDLMEEQWNVSTIPKKNSLKDSLIDLLIQIIKN